jgi:uncharacterized protein (TIGR02646 family)
MININRGAEPPALAAVRDSELEILRKLLPPRTSKQISDKYKDFGQMLCDAQYYKCCYCEIVVQKKFNDVEHYRPKASACRAPGCSDSHGYWWLAYSWTNLMFSCPNCNRSGKNDRFPLARGSASLKAETAPPGQEIPLLIDPADSVNPVEHITFSYQIMVVGAPKQWWALPRDGSVFGLHTIDVCDLNRHDLLEVRKYYFCTVVKPQIDAMNRELANGRPLELAIEFRRALSMIRPYNQFSAFTYDAFRAAVADRLLYSAIGEHWPQPVDVGRLP